jgi:hypothetical protein
MRVSPVGRGNLLIGLPLAGELPCRPARVGSESGHLRNLALQENPAAIVVKIFAMSGAELT